MNQWTHMYRTPAILWNLKQNNFFFFYITRALSFLWRISPLIDNISHLISFTLWNIDFCCCHFSVLSWLDTFPSDLIDSPRNFLFLMSNRMESVRLGTSAGKAKVIGTLLGVGGALVFVFYKGSQIHLWSTHMHLVTQPHDATAHRVSLLGAFLVFGSNFSYSLWLLFQVSLCAYV